MANVRLMIGYGDGRSEARELPPGKYRVGRESADVVIAHASVSGYHADLEVQAQRVVIRDAGSRNGTYDPSGQRLAAAYVLLPEQPIRLGAITLTLLRGPGQAGGTRAMAEVPGPLRAAAQPPPYLAPPFLSPRAAAHAPPPSISRWLKLLGAFAILLLGFVSLRTCTALVQAVGGGP